MVMQLAQIKEKAEKLYSAEEKVGILTKFDEQFLNKV